MLTHGLFNLRSFDIKQEDNPPPKINKAKITKIFCNINAM